MKEDRLRKLQDIVEQCRSCPLCLERGKTVFADGNPNAPFFFVGEGPGQTEALEGLPFVGRSGKLLRSMMAAIGLDPQSSAFIANVVKCRPPKNRAPENSEIDICVKYLRKQIEVVNPAYIVLLGRTAVKALLPDQSKTGLDILRQKCKSIGELKYEGIPVIVTYHPSALLRDPGRRIGAKEDFLHLQSLIKN
jgi:uracil-DNA glycosylase